MPKERRRCQSKESYTSSKRDLERKTRSTSKTPIHTQTPIKYDSLRNMDKLQDDTQRCSEKEKKKENIQENKHRRNLHKGQEEDDRSSTPSDEDDSTKVHQL